MTSLRFGIPSLDRLIHGEPTRGAPHGENYSTSVSIIGPDGTGKSILGLHLASHYLSDHSEDEKIPVVLYVSTDLSYLMAVNRTWTPFALDYPSRRSVPFADHVSKTGTSEGAKPISLVQLNPVSDNLESECPATVSTFLNRSVDRKGLEVGFIDLAGHSAGDDWGYINRVLALLPDMGRNGHAHLMVLDAVEGFETLVGDLDAYGQISTRRTRIAQMMRSARESCHLVFVAEEPTEEKRIPEQFVTDLVIRLRKRVFGDYIRRTIELEKARGQEHVRGMHQYVIRSGRGSTTGSRENLDDPKVEFTRQDENGNCERSLQSYFHVYSSLHQYSRAAMQREGPERPDKPHEQYAAFGIRFLDNMLDGQVGNEVRFERGFETSGLPCASVTALIGDALTQKTRLGRAFLSRCFAQYSKRLREIEESRLRGSAFVQEWLEREATTLPSDNSLKELIPNKTKISEAIQKVTDATAMYGSTPFFAAAMMLKESGIDRFDGPAILFTTHDIDAAALVREFSIWAERVDPSIKSTPGMKEEFQKHCYERTICRRLEVHDMSSAVFLHMVQRTIREAQKKIVGQGGLPEDSDKRFPISHTIRLVIDDFSAVLAAYPELRNDPLFLPALLFHLRREGVTSLIIDTHAGQPGTEHSEPMDTGLRSLVDHRLYTWHVPFYGENRVAISPIPPLTDATVRELIIRDKDADDKNAHANRLVVDPDFELYTGLEDKRPQPVPLEIHMHEETQSFKKYMESENLFYRHLFAPNRSRNRDNQNIVFCMPSSEYQGLQDFCYLDNDVRLDHTKVFEVDEFWAIRESNALANLGPYLQEETIEGQTRIHEGDPFSLFQGTLNTPTVKKPDSKVKRFQSFPAYFATAEPADERIDRVPFCWDFGFLICRKRLWDEVRNDPEVTPVWGGLRKVSDRKDPTRRDREANVTWRAFLVACRKIARAETLRTGRAVPAFDLSLLSPESFSCLVLEVWASEIAANRECHGLDITKRLWHGCRRERGLVEWLDEGADFDKQYDLWKSGKIVEFRGYWLELYATWLMLGETLDLSNLASEWSSFEFLQREADPSAVAVRHWYKTASAQAQLYSLTDPGVPTRLPGKFSVRGDWFLAVSRHSRSLRLAHRAIDILSSRRQNIERLRMGVGLPVRDIEPLRMGHSLKNDPPGDMYEGPRTCLFKPGPEGERHTISFADMVYIGADSQGSQLEWIWRSSLKDYDRHSRVFHQWLCRMMIRFHELRRSRGAAWADGFETINDLQKIQTDAHFRGSFFLNRENEAKVESMNEFRKRLKFLIADLKQASPAEN